MNTNHVGQEFSPRIENNGSGCVSRRDAKAIACVFLLVLLLSVLAVQAQTPDDSLWKDLKWRAIGPAVMGGRIDDVAVVERNPSMVFVGAASGGLWKTISNGTTWEPIFDNQGVASIGDVAVFQADPDIVWVGTGEPNNRQSSTFGDGIYNSTDGGKTWKHMGLRDTQHIGRIVIDPVNPDVVYVAALGHLWGPNKERGLYKTTDGGLSWTNTLFINEDTGCVDVAMDPSNTDILYAAAYQRRRTAWGFNGGGPHSAIYKTVDGSKSWKKLTEGLPSGATGRIGLNVYRRNPGIVYAIIENREGGIFRSADRGETWQRINPMNPRPMYYSQIHIDPNGDKRIYVLSSSFFVSDDGGKSFADPRSGRPGPNTSMTPTYDVGVHGDHHALWINPADSNHLILGGDGGLYFSYDGTVSWDKINNIPLAQFYAIGVDMQKPYYIYGGLQDTHSWRGPSATRHHIGITNADWSQIDFGDGMYAQVDPTDQTTVYIEAQDGNIVRFNPITGDRKNIKPHPKQGEPAYRFNWTAPMQISPHNPKTLYLGGNRLFKTTDRGETWTASQDLTKAEDRDKLPIMGELPSREMLSRHDGVAAWGTLTTLAESPATAGVIWVGTDDGNVQVSRDWGTTWTNVADRIPGLPPKSYVSRVEPSYVSAGTAYASFDRHRDDDFKPYVFMTADFGQSWKAISGNLPQVGWVNVVKAHPKNPNFLIAGTETGLYLSLDTGTRWIQLKGNLPTVPVDDIVIHPRDNDLILGTHGRSIYVLDDMTPLSGLSNDVLNSDSHLFEPRAATTMLLWKNESYGAQRVFIGLNPPQGAILNYYLKAAPAADVKLAILDAQGKSVRELSGTKNAGINRVVWDLRLAPPEGVPGARGPFVLPGKYTVKLVAGGREMSRTLQLNADPLLPVSDADRRARLAFLSTMNGMQATIQSAGAAVSGISTQMTALQEHLKKLPVVSAAITAAAASVADQAREVQRKLGGGGGPFGGGAEEGGGFFGGALRGRVNSLFGEIDGDQVRQGTLTGPTAVQNQRLQEISAELKAVVTQLNNLINSAIPGLNEQMNKQGVPRLAPLQPIAPPR